MTEKIMKNVNVSLEQAQLCNKNTIASGAPRHDRHNYEINHMNKNTIKSERQKKPFSPKSSLDKVAEDIENILGKLNVFQGDNFRKKEPIELKILQKEFFKTNQVIERQKNVTHKSSTTNTKVKTLSTKSLSRNLIKVDTINKQKSGIISKASNCTTSNSNNIVRKVPVTKSELQNFKQKIILSSNQVFKSPERIKYRDKQSIAKNVRRLIEAALKESEHNHRPPVIDVGSFIRQSLEAASLGKFPESTREIDNKASDFSSEIDSESNWSFKLNTMIKERDEEKDNVSENQQEDTRNTEQLNIAIFKKTNKINNSVHPQSKTENIDGRVCRNTNDNKSSHISHPIVQTFRSAPNSCNSSRGSTKTTRQGNSKTTGNRKLPPSKSIVNMNTTQKNTPKVSSRHSFDRSTVPSINLMNTTQKNAPKVSSRHSFNRSTVLSNNLVKTKQIKNKNSQVIEANKKVQQIKSNTTLETLNIRESDKMSLRNVTSMMGSRPSTAKSNSTTASKISGITRNGSDYGEMNMKMSDLERISSSISSKTVNGKKISTHSYLGTSRSTNSASNHPSNPLKQLRDEVNRAIRDRKTFTVRGNHTAVRKALLKRGWVERFHTTNTEKLEHQMNFLRYRSVNELEDMLHVKDLNEICKKLIKSKLLGSHQVDLYWGPNYDSFAVNPDNVKFTKINKFRRDVFSYTSKQGLCDAAKNAHWFNFPGLANIKHPRTYVLARNGETYDFIKDFRRTAAMSLLKWVIKSHEAKDCKIVSNSGKVPLEVFQFAANECCKIVIEANNEDIDLPLKEASDHEWNQFLEYYYKILHIGNHFKMSNLETEATIVEKSAFLIKKLSPHYPHMKMDGTMNIWILKPAVGSQGKGIHICRTLQYIIRTVKNNSTIRYIAQKYIERPLLIFNTKFDIRQWFLISSALPLTIWMYKDCYLRFSSQTYNLRKLHESIHLTNNSVQQRYQNTSRDITLPNYNMWDSQQFKNYLSNIGFPDVYNEVTYKGMKECIIGAVLIHQDKIDKRKNSFELYGADFMLTEDFQPWLIEINSSPALYASTPITSRMCPQVLEDTIKVVVDHSWNPKARTGNFELVYKQENLSNKNSDNIKDLKVSGRPLPRDYFCSDEEKKENNVERVIKNLQSENDECPTGSDIVTKGMKETLESLLKFIHNEKRKRQKRKLIAKGTDPIGSLDKRLRGMRSSSTCTNGTRSITSLKSQWDQFSSNGSISMAKEDVNMIDEALKLLKDTKNGDIIGYLLEIIEKILNKTQQNNREK